MDKVRIGLIGCGGIAGYHVSHLLQFEDVSIVAVADPVKERRDSMAAKVGAQRVYENHTQLYDAESKDTLDAVYICIEPTAHTDTETRAIDAGLPFVVEKPMTLNLKQGEDIAARVAKAGLITSVGFQDRYLDIIDALKAELPKHKPGLVYGAWIGGVPMVWWWLKKATCGGQLVEQNIHILDMLRYLFGEPKSVYATCSRGLVSGIEGYDTDDHSTAVLEFDNAVTATLVSACYMQPEAGGAKSGLLITAGDMVMDYELRSKLTLKTRNETRELRTAIDQGVTADRTFIDAVKSGDGSKIRSPYGDALKTLRVALAANESMDKRAVITL